jgi:hypothetical protein
VPGTTVTASTTILSAWANGFTADVAATFNEAWPMSLGGTGGTSAATSRTSLGVPGLDDANTFTANQTITSTDAGATAGPVVTLYRNSASPDANDILGQVLFNGEDSAGNTQEYGSIQAVASDPTSTSEDGAIDFYVPVAGTRTRVLGVGQYLEFPRYTAPTPTADGAAAWDSDDNYLVVGDGSGQKIFKPSPWETIETRTVTAASAEAFINLSAYAMIRMTGYLAPSVSGITLRIRTSSNNGSSYDSGATDYVFQYDRGAAGTADAGSSNTDYGLLTPFTVGNSAGYLAAFTTLMYAFNKTNIVPYIVTTAGSIDGAGVRGVGDVLATRSSLTARNAFQVFPSSGTMTGIIVLEGIRG